MDAVEAVHEGRRLLWVYINTPEHRRTTALSVIQVHTQLHPGLSGGASPSSSAAIQMAVSHRGEPARDILKSLLTMVVVSGAATAFAGL